MTRARPALLLVGLALVIAPETRAMFPAEPGQRAAPLPGLFITVYDWSLGGQNCDGDCSNTALTTTGPELYGWTAACPSAWLGHIATTVVTIWGQDFYCIDAFGRPEHRGLTTVDGRRVYRIDIAYRPAAAHPWNQEYVPPGDWTTRREWMTTFYELREVKAR